VVVRDGWCRRLQARPRRQWHIAVGTTCLLLEALATPASVQDRHAARPLLFQPEPGPPPYPPGLGRWRLRRQTAALGRPSLKLTVQIVRRPDDLHTFQILPRRWVIERTRAMITLMTRRLARPAEVINSHLGMRSGWRRRRRR
jgi:hypothetical protein